MLARLHADDVVTVFPLLRRAVDELRRTELDVPQAMTVGPICVRRTHRAFAIPP